VGDDAAVMCQDSSSELGQRLFDFGSRRGLGNSHRRLFWFGPRNSCGSPRARQRSPSLSVGRTRPLRAVLRHQRPRSRHRRPRTRLRRSRRHRSAHRRAENGFGIGKASSSCFGANEVALLIKILAYNLMRRWVSAELPTIASWRSSWIRSAAILIPARLLRSGGRWLLRRAPRPMPN